MINEAEPTMRSALASLDLLYFTEHGSGYPLLLVHGLMVTGEMFEPVIEHLAARHRVIIPDLRGHGRSRGLPPPYTAAQLASDVARLLDHLSVGSTAVLGYSQGGAIAQQLALDHPQRCDRLILACTYAYNMATFREKLTGLEESQQGARRVAFRAYCEPGTTVDGGRSERNAGVRQQTSAGRDQMSDTRRGRLERSG